MSLLKSPRIFVWLSLSACPLIWKITERTCYHVHAEETKQPFSLSLCLSWLVIVKMTTLLNGHKDDGVQI